MINERWLLTILVLQYFALAIFYFYSQYWAKGMYWTGLTVLTVSLIFMK